MNVRNRNDRDQEIIKFLKTPVGKSTTGVTLYPTLSEAGVKFDLSPNQIHRIKRKLIGLDKDWKEQQTY